jgi:hypothetical protein
LQAYNSNVVIKDSYSISNIKARCLAGGLLGSIRSSHSYTSVAAPPPRQANIQRSYAAGKLEVENGPCLNIKSGALVGVNSTYWGGPIDAGWAPVNVASDAFWNKESSGMLTDHPSHVGGSGLTDLEMRSAASFTNWDFNSIWKMSSVHGYPVLQWQVDE